jgi:hypothetical protein
LIEWNDYITILWSSGISLNNTRDKIVRPWNKATGVVTANLAYKSITFINILDENRWWYKVIWKVNISGKLICFFGYA